MCECSQQDEDIESEYAPSATPVNVRPVTKDELSIMYTNADALTNKIDEHHERVSELHPDVQRSWIVCVCVCTTKTTRYPYLVSRAVQKCACHHGHELSTLYWL